MAKIRISGDTSGYVEVSVPAVAGSRQIELPTAIDQKLNAVLEINQQTTAYTLVSSDASKIVEMNSASGVTLTVPPQSDQDIAVGSQVAVIQTGAGQVTIAGGSGVTVNATPGLKLRTQWSSATLIKRATDTWIAIGDLVA